MVVGLPVVYTMGVVADAGAPTMSPLSCLSSTPAPYYPNWSLLRRLWNQCRLPAWRSDTIRSRLSRHQLFCLYHFLCHCWCRWCSPRHRHPPPEWWNSLIGTRPGSGGSLSTCWRSFGQLRIGVARTAFRTRWCPADPRRWAGRGLGDPLEVENQKNNA